MNGRQVTFTPNDNEISRYDFICEKGTWQYERKSYTLIDLFAAMAQFLRCDEAIMRQELINHGCTYKDS